MKTPLEGGWSCRTMGRPTPSPTRRKDSATRSSEGAGSAEGEIITPAAPAERAIAHRASVAAVPEEVAPAITGRRPAAASTAPRITASRSPSVTRLASPITPSTVTPSMPASAMKRTTRARDCRSRDSSS
jgi:hypothetical protein